MTTKNIFKELNLSLPVIQAPMAGITRSNMVVASCKAGIIGSLAGGIMQPDQIRESIRDIRKSLSDNKPFNVNLFIVDNYASGYSKSEKEVSWLEEYYRMKNLSFPQPSSYAPLFEEQFKVVLQECPPIVSFTFGILSPDKVEACHKKGAMVIGTATTLKEAQMWEKVGADAICVQGYEAGGHRGSFLEPEDPGVGLFSLIPDVCKNCSIPVIASGGIMQGRDIIAARVLGASAVQMGTAFLGTPEALLPEAYANGIKNKDASDTTLTKAFSGRYARGVKNDFTEYGKGKTIMPYPIQNVFTQPLRKVSADRKEPNNMSLWVGQSVLRIKRENISELCSHLREEINHELFNRDFYI